MPTILLTSLQTPTPTPTPTLIPGFRYLAAKNYGSMADNLNNISPSSSPSPVEEVVSLEVMLYSGKLKYDFAVLENVARRLNRKRGTRKLKEFTMRAMLSNYRKSFEDVLADQDSCWLKLNFYVIRLRLNTFLVERLLRDFLNRSKWHISLLSKKKAAYSSMHLLLREVANFERKRELVYKHIDEAIGYYQLKSGVEFFTLEKEIFGLRNKVKFKELQIVYPK